MARTTVNEVTVTKVVRGFELGETLANSAERLIKAVAKSEKGVRELAMELYTIQTNKLLDETEFNGVGDFFETMTGLSASSASQYLRTFKAFKNYDNDKWCSFSAIVPFSMLTEISKLYGIVKHTEKIIDDGKEVTQTGNTFECGNALLLEFCKIVSQYEDVPEIDFSSDKSLESSIKSVLAYITANWTNKQVRDAIEESDIVCTFEKEKEKKKASKANKKAGKKATDDNGTDDNETDDNETDDNETSKLDELVKLLELYSTNKKMTKTQFINEALEIINA